jgi:hypothetical protein
MRGKQGLKKCYKKQTPTSSSHIPVILIKFEIISVDFKTKRHAIRKKYTNFCLHYITLLRAFGNDRTKLTRKLRADKMENKIFCLRVSDKIKMYNFVFIFIGFIF